MFKCKILGIPIWDCYDRDSLAVLGCENSTLYSSNSIVEPKFPKTSKNPYATVSVEINLPSSNLRALLALFLLFKN